MGPLPSGSTDPSPGHSGRRMDPAAAAGSGLTTREHQINDTFADLAGALAHGEDVIGLLELLTRRCAELLDVHSAGLVLADSRHVLHVMAASSAEARILEILQVQRTEGPCRDCYRTGQQVLVEDLTEHAHRWPQFVAAALQEGIKSVHAVPMRLRSRTLGAMGLFGGRTGTLNDRDLSLAQALADVASIALTQNQQRDDDVTAQLQTALRSRVVLEQAKGVLALRGDLSMTQAFEALSRFARDRNLKLSEVATAVVTKTLPAAALLEDVNTQT